MELVDAAGTRAGRYTVTVKDSQGVQIGDATSRSTTSDADVDADDRGVLGAEHPGTLSARCGLARYYHRALMPPGLSRPRSTSAFLSLFTTFSSPYRF